MSMLDNLEKMLATGRDSPMLRLSLGSGYLKQREPGRAIAHLEAALEQDEHYSAAWKVYAAALAEDGRLDEAITAYRRGIDVAEGQGDKQAVKEMRVFLGRLERQRGA
ncbi:tetratricopeptide repeat protein [Alkalilimnicola ehrlichii MLHE-1]|uniref:TPR repeat-containing protein n=1 Tax=Alkalilimnicola ehrlichii (strain ATCC BAA-1101 / DSM 17681 / MLHE-1) TaxID=187272 RepID=Q0A5C6_ALKEH|nr:tetratricopeptide repeat protein [Alkalilimnicola ehrlichii]ABI57961.1 TPR repeat-containing protein [Alkalilimnicola ehrlichii MLHE-1]